MVEVEKDVVFSVRVDKNNDMSLIVDSPQEIKIHHITSAFQNLVAENETANTGRKSIGKRLKIRIRQSHGNRCAYCGVSDAPTIDHVIPCALGGSSVINNLVPSCEPCNIRKGNMLPREAGMMPRMTAFQLWGQDGYLPSENKIDHKAWVYRHRYSDVVVPVIHTDDDYRFEVKIRNGMADEIRVGKDSNAPTPGYLTALFRRSTAEEVLECNN